MLMVKETQIFVELFFEIILTKNNIDFISGNNVEHIGSKMSTRKKSKEIELNFGFSQIVDSGVISYINLFR